MHAFQFLPQAEDLADSVEDSILKITWRCRFETTGCPKLVLILFCQHTGMLDVSPHTIRMETMEMGVKCPMEFLEPTVLLVQAPWLDIPHVSQQTTEELMDCLWWI